MNEFELPTVVRKVKMSSGWRNCFCNCISVTNIYGVIRPFYYVAKLYGFAPFQLNRMQLSPQDGVTNPVDWIITLFSFCSYSYIMYFFCSMEPDVENLEHTIVTISRGIVYIITNLMSIVYLVSNIVFRHDLLKVVKDFHQIDNEVCIHSYKLIFSQSKLTNKLFLVAREQ